MYKLYKYDHFDLATAKITPGELELPGLRWIHDDELPVADYTLHNSLEQIHSNGFHKGFDYKFVRDKIKQKYLDAVNGWADFDDDQRLILCEHKVGSHAERVSRVGLPNVVLQGLAYDSRVAPCRTVRLAYAKAEMHNYLPNEAPQIITEARDQIIDYIFFGREGTAQGDQEGLSDYFNGLGAWAGAGLINKPWQPEGGLTMQELITESENILFNGIYSS